MVLVLYHGSHVRTPALGHAALEKAQGSQVRAPWQPRAGARQVTVWQGQEGLRRRHNGNQLGRTPVWSAVRHARAPVTALCVRARLRSLCGGELLRHTDRLPQQ